MRRLNRDTLIAALLLCAVGFLFHRSFAIRTPEFENLAPGQMDPGLWPRIILIGMAIMGVIYLFQSILDPPPPPEKRGGLVGLLRHYRNPIWCFAAFAAFLALVPALGLLVAGLLFVFAMMSLLGPKEPRAVLHHFWVALVCVGGMWFVFACLLEVHLPRGDLTRWLDEALAIHLCGLVAAAGEVLSQAMDGLPMAVSPRGACSTGVLPA